MLGHILTAIVTPFREDESIDFDAFQRLAGHLVEHGSDGIVVAGTTGESPNLTDEERLDLFRAAIEAVGDRATVVAGTGTYSTRHSMHLSERAHELGADALLVVTPYYNKPPQRGIVAHFEAIARTSDKPIVVYNIPSRVVINIERKSNLHGSPRSRRFARSSRRTMTSGRPGTSSRAGSISMQATIRSCNRSSSSAGPLRW